VAVDEPVSAVIVPTTALFTIRMGALRTGIVKPLSPLGPDHGHEVEVEDGVVCLKIH
jgi:hypothetical protein